MSTTYAFYGSIRRQMPADDSQKARRQFKKPGSASLKEKFSCPPGPFAPRDKVLLLDGNVDHPCMGFKSRNSPRNESIPFSATSWQIFLTWGAMTVSSNPKYL